MNQSSTLPLKTEPTDEDMIEKAHPGHGIPSQDPAIAAQFRSEPEQAQREANSVLAGGGVVAGAATGAAIGVVVAGVLGAAAAGTMMNPDEPE